MDKVLLSGANELLAHIEQEIAKERAKTMTKVDRLYELDYDSKADIRRLWRDYDARVAPMLAQRESIIKALANVRAAEMPPLVIVTG